jgi:hypothetical protein
MFKRALVRDNGGGVQEARAGDGWLVAVAPFIQDAPGPAVMQAGDLAGGLLVRVGLIADTADISPDAAAILELFPTMDIGETVMIAVSNQSDFVWSLTPGVDVTIVGKDNVAATSFGLFLVQKTSATEITVGGL